MLKSFLINQTTLYLPQPPQDSDTFHKLESSGKIIKVDDIIDAIEPGKPVVCITGTNGKTTTTHLLKHIARIAGLKTTEHGFKTLQGNVDYIPPYKPV